MRMKCTKCGCENTEKAKFCKNCGSKMIDESIPVSKKNWMFKNMGIIGLIAVVCISSCFLYFHSKSICGQWIANESRRDYPENNFVIYKDGTFTSDGYSGTYSKNGDVITFSFEKYGAYTYKYKVSGNRLSLISIKDIYEEPVYYDRY